jgi:PAS domain S-box-containing protein
MISLLYIDDEPGLLELGKLFLESAGGFEVSTALSGDEGLEQLAQHDFDAIVSDFQMPGMDGIALLKKVRKSFGTIPFVLFTGRGREEVVIEAINNGVDFYLQKGGDPKAQFAELAHKVWQAVSRRRAETALSDSEKRLADIINFLPDATFAIDTHGVVIAWNRAMERMTGFRAEDVLGKGDYEYALPFYHERRPLLINLVLDNDPAIAEKYPFVKREGRTLFSEITIPHFNEGRGAALWFTASPLYDRKGEIAGAIESIREITERKRAEEELVSANREYTNLLDQIQDVYYRSDSQGRLVRASRSWATLLGYNDVSECIGRNIADDFYFNPPDRERLLAGIAKNGKVTGYEVTLKKKDGTPVIVEVSSHPYFDPAGTTIGIEGMFRDITGRKKAEEERRESEKRFRELAELLPQGVYETDIHGRMTYVNRLALEMYGYTEEDIGEGVSVADAIAPEDRERASASFHRMAVEGTYPKGSAEYLALRKDGTTFPIAIYSSQILRDGKVIGVRGSIIDITERKKAEDEIRAANEQLVASEEELRAQYDELALGEKRVRMSESRLRYMLGFNEYAKKSEKELLGYAIEGAGVVTDSPLGYLAFLNEDESELSMYAWSKNAMAECSMITKPVVYKTEKTGLWGEAVRQRRAVITNDYAAPDPAKKGYPEGHPRIVRHMNVPVIDEGHVILVAGVANKQSDYTENDVNELLLLMQGLWNILKRRRAEETRNESEAKYRNIINHAPAGMHFYELKPDGSLVFTGSNPGADRILGIVHSQFIGKTIEEAFPPLTETEIPAQYRRVAADGGTWQTEQVIYDGEAIHGAYAVTAFQTSPGAMVAMFMDITKRKRAETDLKAAYELVASAEEELREQYDTLAAAQAEISSRRQQLEEIASTVPGVVYQFWARPDGSRGMYYTSNRTNEIFGLESNLERFFPEFTAGVHPDDRPAFLSSIDDAVNRRAGWHFEGRFIRHSGETIWFEGLSSPVVHGDELVFTGVILDITGRKRMEEAIRESEGRYRSLVELSPDAVVVHRDGKVLYANPEALRLVGAKTETEMIGREVISFIHPDDRPMALEDFRLLYEEGKLIQLKEERLLRINGDPFTVEVTASPIQYPGGLSVLAVFRDITDRKQAEAALRESEEKYRSLVENIPFGITLIDADHRIVISNTAQGQMFHTDAGLWTGRYCYREFEKRDAVCTHCPGTRAMATGVRHEVETEGVRDDGTRFNARIHAIPLVDNEGKGTRFIEVVEDITERKKAEDALRQNEEKYRALVETTGTGFVILDHEGRVLDANPEYIRMTGHTRLEDISGRNVTEWTAAHEQERNADAVRQCIRDGFIRNFEIDYTDNSGAITPVEINATVVQSEGAVHILTLCRDITDRKRAEDELLRLKISTDRSSDEIFWMDFAGNILYVNDAACRVTGYSREEFLKMKIFELDPDFLPGVWDASVADLRERKTQFITTRHRRKDGVIIDVEIVAVYVNQYDQEYSFAYVRDVTGRKRTEEALFSSQQMLQAVLDSIPQRVFWKDRNSVFLGCNKPLALDAGYPNPADMVGKTDYDHASHATADLYRADDRQVMETGQPRINYEEPQIRPDGSQAWLRTTKVPLRNKEGAIIGVLGTYEDITEQKQAREALRESEEKYRTLVESSFDGIAIHQDGILVYVNRTAARILGSDDPGVFAGKPAIEVVAPAFRERITDRVQRGPERSQELIHEQFLKTDGTAIDVDVTSSPCTWKGKPAVYVTFRDITAQVRAEEAFRESSRKYAELFELGSEALFLIDNETGALLETNSAACEMYGYPRDILLTMKNTDLSAEQEDTRKVTTETPQGIVRVPLRYHRRRDGTVFPVEIIGRFFVWNGRPVHIAAIRDITEHKRAEAALVESEEKYRTLVEVNRDIIYSLSADGTILYVSPQALTQIGYQPDEMVGRNFTDFIHPGDKAMLLNHIQENLRTGNLGHSDRFRVHRKDGVYRWFEDNTIYTTDRQQRPVVVSTIRDITEEKAAQDALRESEARLSSILHGSPVLQFVIDRDHHVISWNKALEEYSGIKAADIIGTDQQWRAFYPEKRAVLADLLVDGNTNAISSLYAGKFRQSRYVEEAFEATDYFPHMGSSGIWLSFTAAPIRDMQGNIIGAVETLEDVTDRVTAENALRESSERTRTILDTAQAGIVLVDATNHTIVDANKKALELIGLDRDSVIGAVCHRFICSAEQGKCPVTDCGQKVDTSERVLITAAGEKIPVLKTVVPVSISGRDVLVESFVDIAEQKRSEAAIREANRKLNLLNSITRHDIRNQLTVAQGYTQLAALSKPEPVIMDFLAKITTAIDTIQRQIEFTKTYQELGVHAPAWFRVIDVVSSVRPEKVTLYNTCKAIEIFADPMIDRVFFNLFDNALNYGERVTTVTVGCGKRKNSLVISFADNGTGIAPGEKQKIFEKGYGKNTGLGLFLVREILAITGMTISETGTPGEGAVFEIVVPEGAYRNAE